jgi:hypothetical protein
LIALLLGTALLFLAGKVHAEDRRRYDDGPLVASDFRGRADSGARSAALTSTELRYEFHYRYSSPDGKSFRASLQSIDIHAAVRRDLSWNKNPESERLLDHEQGHADNAQIGCLQALLHFADRKTAKEMKATAPTQEQAVAALREKITERMRRFESNVRVADEDYDRETMNGLGGKQAEWRRVQQETLKRLEAEWGKVSKK